MYYCSVFLQNLEKQHAVDDLSSPRLTPDMVWEAVLRVSQRGGPQRNLRSFLSDAFPRIREDGTAFEEVLNAGRLQTDVPKQAGYAPSVADAIEAFVKPFVAAWYIRHRAAVASALGEQRKDWLTLPAQTIIRAAELASSSSCIYSRYSGGPTASTSAATFPASASSGDGAVGLPTPSSTNSRLARSDHTGIALTCTSSNLSPSTTRSHNSDRRSTRSKESGSSHRASSGCHANAISRRMSTSASHLAHSPRSVRRGRDRIVPYQPDSDSSTRTKPFPSPSDPHHAWGTAS